MWSLRKKILVSEVLLLLLLGAGTLFVVSPLLSGRLREEFLHKGVNCAKSITANSVVDTLTQNASRLKQLIDNEKSLDKDIAYIFIVDSSGNVLAHTFSDGFPVNLPAANSLKENRQGNVTLLDTQLGRIYDIAEPVLLEKSLLGQVRVGIIQKSIQNTVALVNLILSGITLLVVFIGILLTYKISSLITKPISKLVEAARSIQKGDFSVKIGTGAKDEIGLLAQAFNEMASRLNAMLEERKRFALEKERNRIAVDFHAGCAQDLASIIKRLELAQRLIYTDQAQALKELEELRENTKDTLGRARQVIFESEQSKDNCGYDLLEELVSFLKDYQKANHICVKCAIRIPINDIPSPNAKAIFNIIKEAFTNIKKHALAKNVSLNLGTDAEDNLVINIKDEGSGFDVNNTELGAVGEGRWGLKDMRQRVELLKGKFLINSSQEKGTQIIISIPYKHLKEL